MTENETNPTPDQAPARGRNITPVVVVAAIVLGCLLVLGACLAVPAVFWFMAGEAPMAPAPTHGRMAHPVAVERAVPVESPDVSVTHAGSPVITARGPNEFDLVAGAVRAEGKTLEELETLLADVENPNRKTIRLLCDRNLPNERIVDIMDACMASGFDLQVTMVDRLPEAGNR